MPPHRRRQYLINKHFQYKVIFLLSLMVATIAVAGHFMAYSYAKLVQSTQAAPAVAAGPVTGGSADIFWLPILIAVLLGIIFVLVFGLLYSHRIAGPLFNLKRVMERVGQGDLTTVMHIRATDEFHDVEAAFNTMVSGLNQKIEKIRGGFVDLPSQEKRRMERLLADHLSARAHTDSPPASLETAAE